MKRGMPPVFLLLLGVSIFLLRAAGGLRYGIPGLGPRRARRWRPTGALAALMWGVSQLGRPLAAAGLITLAAAVLAWRRRWLEAAFVLATVTGPGLSYLLKAATRRPRPKPGVGDDFLGSLDRYSFPSGHVVFFEVFFGFIAYLAYVGLGGVLRWMMVALGSLLIMLVGPSRVFLDAHWASDVAGGYLIGGLWLMLMVATYRRARRAVRGREGWARIDDAARIRG